MIRIRCFQGFLAALAWATALSMFLVGCGPKPRPEPEVRVVQVKVETPVPCPALQALGPEPIYPDNDAAIAAASTLPDPHTAADKVQAAARVAKLYAQGRILRIQRLTEYTAVKAACVF
tara:strand:- start:3447 stop:3803 length:357 start_codon:yes stop_codon:yes gene_type:complete